MYSGRLINDLFVMVERAELAGRESSCLTGSLTTGAEPRADIRSFAKDRSESEQFPQPLGLSAAHWNLSLLLIVHAQLIRALEPWNNFTDAVDVHQVGAVRPPKTIRV